jgi:hypothetical protein
MNTTQVYLQEEYAKTEIAKLKLLRRTSWFSTCKTRIREIAALLLIDKLRNNLGITSASPAYTCHLQVVQELGKQQLV